MCNAHNHYSGCECGWGPPYLGSVVPARRETWRERSVTSPVEFARGHREVGIGERAVIDQLDRYNSYGFPLARAEWELQPEAQRRPILEQLERVIRRYRQEVVGEPECHTIRIPLFRLDSPPVEGSRVVYEDRSTERRDNAWAVQILGIGTGDTQSFEVEYEAEFEARNGDCKMIFLPVDLHVSLVRVYRGNRQQGEALKAEVDPSAYGGRHARGIARCGGEKCQLSEVSHLALKCLRHCEKRGECALQELHGPRTYPLFDDDSGDIARYSISEKLGARKSRGLGFNLSAFNLSSAGRIETRRTVGFKISAFLPSGYDYAASRLKGVDGLSWRILRGPAISQRAA